MFTAEKVTRNEDGLWWHSALDDLPEETAIETLPAAEGMQFSYVAFDDDAPDDLQKAYDEASSMSSAVDWTDVVKQWEPHPPNGDGWFLVAIYDTEDGPYACFGRCDSLNPTATINIDDIDNEGSVNEMTERVCTNHCEHGTPWMKDGRCLYRESIDADFCFHVCTFLNVKVVG